MDAFSWLMECNRVRLLLRVRVCVCMQRCFNEEAFTWLRNKAKAAATHEYVPMYAHECVENYMSEGNNYENVHETQQQRGSKDSKFCRRGKKPSFGHVAVLVRNNTVRYCCWEKRKSKKTHAQEPFASSGGMHRSCKSWADHILRSMQRNKL